MRFKKFKSRLNRSQKAESSVPSSDAGLPEVDPTPSPQVVRPPTPPFDYERRERVPSSIKPPTVAEMLDRNRPKSGRRPIGPPRKNSIAPEGFLTLIEVAQVFGMTYWTVRRWAVDEMYFGKTLRVGHRVFVARRAVEDREREWEAQLEERTRQDEEEDEEEERWWR